MSLLAELKEATSLHEIAALLGYKPSAISYLLYKYPSKQKYRKFEIQKKSGGSREIWAPAEPLKLLQRRIANVLYACASEIDSQRNQRSLSHGYREGYSIITNARPHKRRRFVLNLDLQDFFPTFNFGRVRGFFLKNRDFELNEKVATVIAQIACHENALPQGSPCSPIIADLIAHVLDVRLAQLAKRTGATYTRYADDLTFSTNQKTFPQSLANCVDYPNSEWTLGTDLLSEIQNAGFSVNPTKTRMQCKTGRQLVTGLTVNTKVNIRPEYYRQARAMCHSLFTSGKYYRSASDIDVSECEDAKPETETSLAPLEGILSHISHVKDSVDQRQEADKSKNPTAAQKLHAKFLFFRYFVVLQRPLIVCEGKTDNVYLALAIRSLSAFHPKLGSMSGDAFQTAVSFFSYSNQAHNLLELHGGTGSLKYFLLSYRRKVHEFAHRPIKHPVIVLIDNDDGAKDLVKVVKNAFGVSFTTKSSDPFFHLASNLYLVKTPEKGKTGVSCIEDLFDASLKKTKLGNKKFNPNKGHDSDNEYGKAIFADKVVRPNASKIDFSKFAPLLARIVAVVDDYKPPSAAA